MICDCGVMAAPQVAALLSSRPSRDGLLLELSQCFNLSWFFQLAEHGVKCGRITGNSQNRDQTDTFTTVLLE